MKNYYGEKSTSSMQQNDLPSFNTMQSVIAEI